MALHEKALRGTEPFDDKVRASNDEPVDFESYREDLGGESKDHGRKLPAPPAELAQTRQFSLKTQILIAAIFVVLFFFAIATSPVPFCYDRSFTPNASIAESKLLVCFEFPRRISEARCRKIKRRVPRGVGHSRKHTVQ